ncbi:MULTISPECIES: tyrosine-type recombinase/integrase [Clostridium]|uniref:Tyrosine-type recombinase/integrase n=1 Tax=Clostridium frigoriphilum TaxID=443253 RepID=A0ABU7UVK3_9CLOT|nr:tyrosine-type recombinase/integrase [Clostridium sp. DSM 17811]MBU3101907.1 tyrosine-type recombinase/integrase [Clostridium sp. DSM 17811]
MHLTAKLCLNKSKRLDLLRHTYATILISQNVDVSTVSKRLGHARTSTTMDIYSHSLQRSDSAAAYKLENLFNKKERNKKQGL